MSLLKDLPFFDESDMPISGAYGVSSDCQAQLIPDSMTMTRYYELQNLAAQKKVCSNFQAVLADVKAGKYSNARDFAAAMGKNKWWVSEFRRVAIQSYLVSGSEWKLCFKRKEETHRG